MKKIFTGDVVSYSQQLNVVDEIKRDLPATLSLAQNSGIAESGNAGDDEATQFPDNRFNETSDHRSPLPS